MYCNIEIEAGLCGAITYKSMGANIESKGYLTSMTKQMTSLNRSITEKTPGNKLKYSLSDAEKDAKCSDKSRLFLSAPTQSKVKMSRGQKKYFYAVNRPRD